MKIAILSDTHSLLRPEVEEEVKTCDAILHGGDIASQELYDKVKAIAPTHFVRGKGTCGGDTSDLYDSSGNRY